MRIHRRFSVRGLASALLAGWLLLACGHCWALAGELAAAADAHCHQGQPAPDMPECCDHGGGEALCPGAEIGLEPVAERSLLPGSTGLDLPPAMAAELQPWPSLRTVPPRLAAVYPFPIPNAAVYLRHCAFLE